MLSVDPMTVVYIVLLSSEKTDAFVVAEGENGESRKITLM